MNLVEQILELHERLRAATIPHAFGGALALAWCTERARGTIDIDINLFVDIDDRKRVYEAFPPGISVRREDETLIARDGQARLWWDHTPVDVFFNTTRFHEEAATRTRIERFGGEDVPFLACRDLAVFKAFVDRTKDWADLEEMAAAGALDAESVLGVLTVYLGGDDPRIEKVRDLASP